ncbi:MAG: hypothetical protein LBB41_05340 [Prevotellaceae bacterium]|jgi:hypothetical protein|nr:hypothetical protein [Prevotellaceae bacterium]
MKKIFYIIISALMLVFMASWSGCEKPETTTSQDNDIVVFELQYGMEKTLSINDETITFSIIAIVDNMINCSLVDFISPEAENEVRIHVFLNVVKNGATQVIKVSSHPCGVLQYINDGSDLEHINNLLAEWQNSAYPDYFEQKLVHTFGNGTLISNNLFIHIAKAYPVLYEQVPQEQYKFIFITSNF